jgi:hypothetical protein
VPLGATGQVVLSLSASGDLDLPAERFDQAAGMLRRLDPRTLRRVVAEHYLDLYNDTWCQDDEDLDLDGFVCVSRRPALISTRSAS